MYIIRIDKAKIIVLNFYHDFYAKYIRKKSQVFALIIDIELDLYLRNLFLLRVPSVSVIKDSEWKF